MQTDTKPFGLLSGIGMVVANMIGAGIFLTTGFMAQDLSPVDIMLAWAIGGMLALCGVRAYSAVAVLVPQSGGEYRFLSTLLHGSLGYLAGWISFFVGFSAPMAIDALAVGAFAQILHFPVQPRVTASLLIIALTVAHGRRLKASVLTQNFLVALKVFLLLFFVVIGLSLGSWEWPTWMPPEANAESRTQAFITSLFFVMFTFSGWNAAVYAAGEFRDPRRDVPRAMLIGCISVTVLYLLLNWIFITNVTPDESRVVFEYESTRITLAHLVVAHIAGPLAGSVMSGAMIVVLSSALSALMLLGGRVCAAMAQDGYFPGIAAGDAGRQPQLGVIALSSFALMLVWSHHLKDILQNVGVILTIPTALVALSLFRVAFDRRFSVQPTVVDLIAAGLYVIGTGIMLYFGVAASTSMLLWVGGLAIVSLGFYLLRKRGPDNDHSQRI